MADEGAASSERGLILVADDNADIRRILRERLEEVGYDVITAESGDAAYDLAIERHPDLIVLDVMTPGRTGWEVSRALRKRTDMDDVKILILTGVGATINEATSPLYGADAYVDKPFDLAVLEAQIADLIAGH